MRTLEKINQSKTVFAVLLALIFLFMLVCNYLTPYLMDDFAYMYNVGNPEPERIESIGQIVSSMQAHRFLLNGRIVAHSIVQMFMMFPKAVFNIANAAVFTLQIFLLYCLANHKKERNNLLIPALFGALWCFEVKFGSINLWMDGSVNYLWATTICILYLIPFLNRFFDGKRISQTVLQILYLIFSFLMGAYSENSSFAVMVIAVALVIWMMVKKEKVEWYFYASIVLAVIGYLYMVSAPATHTLHETKWDIASLGNQFADTVKQYKNALPLLILLLVLFIHAIADRMDKTVLIRAGVFFAGSLISNFVMMAASYYPDRSTATPFVFLILANATLIAEMFRGKRKVQMICLLSAMLLASCFEWVIGLKDIYTCNRKVNENKEWIYAALEEGKTEVVVPVVNAETKYSALYEISYLNKEDTEAYPNDCIKWYYGLDSILGCEPEK